MKGGIINVTEAHYSDLLKDRERLEWLMGFPHHLYKSGEGFHVSHLKTSGTKAQYYTTAREAIDAAMEAEDD